MTKLHTSIILPVCALLLTACAGGESPAPATEKASDASLLYAENFDDGKSCFDPEVLASAALSIENGELIMEVTDSGQLFWSTCEEVVLDNFTLDWIANLTESPSGDSCWVDLPERIEPGQWNHFEITANGPVLTYKVNDIFVASVNDPRLTQGTIALLAGTHSGDSARVKIDNIRITTVEE